MNPETSPPTSWANRHPLWTAAGAAVVANTVFYTGVVVVYNEFVSAKDSGTESQLSSWGLPIEGEPTIADHCRSLNAEEPLPPDEHASKCVEYLQGADVALLYRAGGEAAAIDLAVDVTRLLREQTNDLLRVDITPVPIDADVTRAYDARYAAQGCAPANDHHDWSAMMALESGAIPQLTEYDAVVSLTTLPACDGTLGSSNAADGVVEVFGVHIADGNIYSTATDESPDRVITATAHETAHQFGMGHAGLMLSSEASSQEINGQVMRRSFAVLADAAPKDGPIDIVDWVSQADYTEYREGSLMGFPDDQADLPPIDILQQYYLEWPYRSRGKGATIRGVDLAEERAVFRADDDQPLVAHISLGGYIAPPHADDDEDFAKFTQLAFTTHDTEDNDEIAVDVYVAHPLSRDVALLGTIYAYDTKQFELYAGTDAQITVDVDMANRTISLTKHP